MNQKQLTKRVIIYHNPRCSKSRKALQLLQSKDIEITVIEYLKTPLNLEQLSQLCSCFSLSDLVRTSEPVFKELGLSLNNERQVLEAMVKEPILMQRPIIVYNRTAIIARPPEKVLDFIDELLQ
ncbi:TPA: arsenate reductase (glutaredoxin) [Legionella pneumophila]|nr:arsenate reductase (glutaredoxin) [Legionella pneumophila]HAU2129234.1 arsenate reductase (glutaredoxin) [Legionella pneumophila]HAU3984796.1 arsenate reductase (glutaredoxin) [Legionella pneumophila]HAU4213604.1 arsenate reductase (glutaredoxin) [Legionella pneumophila]HBD9358668.1 arsenate reductase (glutaredoxin) [Legionella pneumophila]